MGMQVHHFTAMNTLIELKLVCEPDVMDKAIELAADWFEESERIFSRFRSDSELSGLNRADGAPVLVSSIMMDVLQLAEQYWYSTAGIFSPFVGDALAKAGYDRSFERLEAAEVDPILGLILLPQEANSDEATEHGNWQQNTQPFIQLDPYMKSVQIRPGTQLDLGGIVKSWAASKLAEWLRGPYGISAGLVNAGGDLIAWQPPGKEPIWTIDVTLPTVAEEHQAIFRPIKEGAIATSGSWRRQWKTSVGASHHLIDPRSGTSASSGIVQCTVAGPDPIACEVWAKTICIAGDKAGLALLRSYAPEYEAVIVDRLGQVHVQGAGWRTEQHIR